MDQHHYEQVGDILDEEPNDNIMRVYIQNLNGLCWDQDGGRWPYICASMASMQVDVACFSEINTNTNQYAIRKKMESIAQQHFTHTKLVMATSASSTIKAYKPGGTAIMACNAITSYSKSHTRDRMGRWSSISFNISSTKVIRIISAYQVCTTVKAGTTTAAAQQQAQLITEQHHTGSNHRMNPRQAFIADLQSFIQQLQSANEDILLVGDFNEEITNSNSGMSQLASTCGLIDLFALRLGSATTPATYQRGTKRLDYILLSPTLIPHVHTAGYDPFNYRIPSDHRGMFIDFTADTLFQQTFNDLVAPARRDFSSKTPGVVNSYVTAKMKYLNDHQFFARMQNLLSQEVLNSELVESLDRDFQRASAHAARQCTRKKRTPWSPKLALAWATVHFYRIAKSALQTPANHTQAIQRLQNQWPSLPREIPTEIDLIQTEYAKAVQSIKLLRAQAQSLREDYLAQQASKYTTNDNKDKARIIQRILRSETQQQIYKKIRFIRNQDECSTGLSQLKIPKGIDVTDTKAMKELPDTNEYWETITVPKTIEELLLRRNRHHFGQATETPFATPPLSTDVGYKADGFAADVFLLGEMYNKTVSPAARLLTQHLQSRSLNTLEGTITPQQILGKLKSWREETTTSPSGLHLGHYHCLWRSPTPGDDPNEQERIRTWQKQLLNAMAELLNYAIRFKYTFQRWTKVINVMLQKDPGNPRVHRLRVIHIYEADYNLLLAVKWRQALHHAEDNNLLNDGMYGSRPGRSAHEPVLLEVLQNEVYRSSMKSGVNFDLDATSCYDRILPNVASLSSRRMGMHPSIVFVNALTLERAQYHLKTNLGVSEGSYTHCQQYPIYGTGQGSGNSPTIWCFVCSLLFDTFETHAHGAVFSCYHQHYKVNMYMIGFVDDCSQRVNLFEQAHQPTVATLVRLMAEDAQRWNDILSASGGALEQTKCSFHLIQSNWNADGTPFLSGNTIADPLILVDHHHTTTITHKSNYTSHKTLGCYINPAHNNHSTWKNTQAKNMTFTKLLDTNYFSRWEAQVFYNSVYLPSITYPLPMNPLSQQQCRELNSRLFQSLLPRLGYNRHTATALRYAPRNIGGIGLKHLYHEQGGLLLQHIYKHLNSPQTTVGRMLRIALSWTQAFLGTSRLILTDVHDTLPPIGPSIFIDLRQFLQQIDAKILLHDFPKPLVLRQRDRFIMDIATGQASWSSRQLQQINACRRFLQAHTLADISNSAGTRLLSHVIHGTPSPDTATIRVAVFNQCAPGPMAWKTWRRFTATFCSTQGFLYTPLGPWLVDHTKTRHRSPYVMDPNTGQLYSHDREDLYKAHTKVGLNDYLIIPTAPSTRVNGYPTQVILCNDLLRPICSHRAAQPPSPIYIPSCQTHQPLWVAALLNASHNLVPLTTILHHIKRGNIVTCSDGSAAAECKTFGFVIATKQGLRLVQGSGIVPGRHGNSFRSEAYGVLATLLWLRQAVYHIPSTHQYPTNTYHHLDNKSVISRLKSSPLPHSRNPNTQLLPEQDVIQQIMSTLVTIPWPIEFEWVRGHQDSHSPFHELQLPAQLNCEADAAASTCAYRFENAITPFPNTPCQLIIRDEYITRILKTRAIKAATIPEYHAYLSQKYGWDSDSLSCIDWDTMSMILKKYHHQWSTIVKHLHDISPTGKIAHRNDPSLPESCPVCPHPTEDNHHIMRCLYHTRTSWRRETLQQLKKYDTIQSDPHLMDILQEGIRCYFTSADTIDHQRYPDRYQTLIHSQNSLGWGQLFKARWSKHWRELQEAYRLRSQAQELPHAGEKWVLYLGRILIHQWLKVWELRNAERHGRDKEEQSRIRRQIMTTALFDLYTYKTKVCPSDRSLFHDSVDDHLARHPNISQVEEWITLHRDVIRASVAAAQRQGITSIRAIYEYPAFNPDIQPGQQANLPVGLQPR